MLLRCAVALLAAFLLVAGCDRPDEPAPAAELGSSSHETLEVSSEQQAAILEALEALHAAYQARDLEAVLGKIHLAIENTAQEYQSRHPEKEGAVQEIRDAFRAFHEDIFRHEDYHLQDFQSGFADFKARPDGTVEVFSNIPIIGTEAMTFEDTDGTPATIRLRLGRFVMRLVGGSWQIAEMDLF
ncbi:MAG: hypothetical protein ACOX9B_10715 [Candidatus Xenobium sp.]|jgi:hypothetical protein|nr:nuclear transport factor 2 family protein [Burkholderiales bacterium]